MPKLAFNARIRETLDYTTCFNCSTKTFEIDQNKCSACQKYMCFGCAALKRIKCCEEYKRRFWPGFMKPEVKRLKRATEEGDTKRVGTILKRFIRGGATNIQIEMELARHDS